MISFRTFLNEVFDSSLKYDFYEKTTTRATYRFPVDKNQWIYVSVYRDQGDQYELEFYRGDVNNRNTTVELTGTKDSIKVLSTVIKIYVDHFKGKLTKNQSLRFSADRSESSRVSLYKKMANQMAQKIGGHVYVYGEKERDDYVEIFIWGSSR